jgi:hypothetical protein
MDWFIDIASISQGQEIQITRYMIRLTTLFCKILHLLPVAALLLLDDGCVTEAIEHNATTSRYPSIVNSHYYLAFRSN